MEIHFEKTDKSCIALLTSDAITITDTESALDLLASCGYNGASGVVISEHNLSPNFFDLKTGMAGEILQKFSTYNMRLAIVGNFSKYRSKSLSDFIFESNKIGHIIFTDSINAAKKILTNNDKPSRQHSI